MANSRYTFANGDGQWWEPHSNDSTVFRQTWEADTKLNRRDGPAVIAHDAKTGALVGEAWYTHGKLNREDGPAIVEYDRLTGAVRSSKWYRNGEPIKPPIVFPETRPRQSYNPTRHHFDI